MAKGEPKLKRSVFGYTSRSINRLLHEQEAVYREQLETQTRLARQQSANLQTKLDSARDEIEALTEKVHSKERELNEAVQVLRHEKEQIGYLRRSVNELGQQFRAVSEVVDHGQEAVASMASLEAELASAKDELRMKALETWTTEQENTKLREHLAALEEQLQRRERDPPEGGGTDRPAQEDPVAKLVARAMSSVLDSAVTNVVQQVRRSSVEQLQEAESLRRETRAELERLAVLREATAPLIRSVQVGMQRAQASIVELPDRVADALSPLTESLEVLVDPIRGLAEVMGSDPVVGPHESDDSTTIELPESDAIYDATSDDATSDDPEPTDGSGSSESWTTPRWITRPD